MLVFGPMAEAHVERVRSWLRNHAGADLAWGLDDALLSLSTFCDPQIRGDRLSTLVPDRCTTFGNVPSCQGHVTFRCVVRRPGEAKSTLTMQLELVGASRSEEGKLEITDPNAHWEISEIPEESPSR